MSVPLDITAVVETMARGMLDFIEDWDDAEEGDKEEFRKMARRALAALSAGYAHGEEVRRLRAALEQVRDDPLCNHQAVRIADAALTLSATDTEAP